MKRSFLFILLISFALPGCKKSDSNSGSGTVTIDNTLSGNDVSGYYTYGFLFSKGKKVSTLEDPGPDILILIDNSVSPNILTLQANNLNPSFYKIGDYPDAQSAQTAFNELKTVGSYQWTGMAAPIANNQVWVYKTGTGCYAKIRLISTLNEIRNSIPYAECTFEWVYQPDGSTTFPSK